MKKLIFILIPFMMLATSCDFLETKVESNITTQNFFQTAADFDMALTGIYYTFTSVEWDASTGTGTILPVSCTGEG